MNAPADRQLEKYSVETITERWHWTPDLFSFRTTRPAGFRFTAGQFARLAVTEANGEVVGRAYSMISVPADEYLEFYAIVVPGGRLTERLIRLDAGDEILVDRTNYGFLTTDRFAGAAGIDLWMLASGTGLAPFVSILGEADAWTRFARLILVHSVRHAAELAYRDHLLALPAQPPIAAAGGADKLRYVPVVTREPTPGALDARITTLIGDGRLEAAADCALDPERSRIMVCGNPEMVGDLRRCLEARGFRVDRRKAPGQMAFENYW